LSGLGSQSWIEEDKQPAGCGRDRGISIDVFNLNRSVRDSHHAMIL
jgi:hypothetical protein